MSMSSEIRVDRRITPWFMAHDRLEYLLKAELIPPHKLSGSWTKERQKRSLPYASKTWNEPNIVKAKDYLVMILCKVEN